MQRQFFWKMQDRDTRESWTINPRAYQGVCLEPARPQSANDHRHARTGQLPIHVRRQPALPQNPLRKFWTYTVAKRSFDLALAVTLTPLLFPLLVLLTLLTSCCSKGPVFYRHLRVGRNCRAFYLYKFRTMFLDGDARLQTYLAQSPDAQKEWNAQYKLRRDPRVTPLGRFLRRTSLDELPQIVNILLGQMSFVGPRPIVPAEIGRYGEAFAYYAAAKPGITGLWQVSGRGTVSYQRRVALDVRYVMTWSLLRDLQILLKTPRAVCSSEGAY